MADKTLPPEGLSGAPLTDASARRAFLRRAVGIGVPVVLATIPGRRVLAQDEGPFSGGCGSVHASGWLVRNQNNPDVDLSLCDQPEPEPFELSKPDGGLFEPAPEEESGLNKTHGGGNSTTPGKTHGGSGS
jgi:hypothetical protein